MTTSDEIVQAETDLAAVQAAFHAAKDRLAALRVRQSEELHGIKPGVQVRDRKGRYGVCTKVRPEASLSKPWIDVKMYRKDGVTPSEREACLYSDWEIVQR